jgi:hypothetical protein
VQDKGEWVDWAGKILMPRLHAQVAMEKVDAARAEQEEMEELRRQDERAQQEQEWAAKEAELDEKEAKCIQQVNAKEIDKARFCELLSLDLERVMGRALQRGRPQCRTRRRERTG